MSRHKINSSPLERVEQEAVVKWANTVGLLKYPELAIDMPDGKRFPIWATPNERKQKPHIGAMMKRQGVFSGVPDLFIPVSKRGYLGLYIELKRINPPGEVSPTQKAVLKWLNEKGYFAIVCYGAERAIKEIEWYL